MRSFFRLLRRLLTAFGVIVLLVAVIATGILWLTLPPRSQQVRIPGLSGPVDIGFDADGIPRIRAGSTIDAAAALGFVHARDRMFQMELMRRAASGRLSEIAGRATLGLDRTMRTLGLRRRAVEDYPALPPGTRACVAGLCPRGQRLDRRARPVQRGGDPDPRDTRTLGPGRQPALGRDDGIVAVANWRTELSRLSLSDRVPQPMIDGLWPPAESAGRPEAGITPSRQYAASAHDLLSLLPRFPNPYTLPGSASNEWAVDGRHSATGAPLLAGDPHLAFGFPAIWYLARIETPDGVLAGATAPGVPGVVLGHNGHIAWSFTTTGADVQDIFIETPAVDGQYQTPDGPRPFGVREERIKVRGEPDQVLTVRETRHGPVLSDLREGGGPILAVAMANLAPGNTAAAGLLALNQAQNVEAAGKAAALITSPVQNLLVADRQRIALFVTGRVPIRRAGDGSAPVPVTARMTGPAGHQAISCRILWLPQAEIHQRQRPDRASRLPHVPGARLVRRLALEPDPRTARAVGPHSLTDFAGMQIDVRSDFARQILPALLAVPAPGADSRARPGALEGLGRQHAHGQPQPLIFNAWVHRFYGLVLRRQAFP